jgi:hypothetical protein
MDKARRKQLKAEAKRTLDSESAQLTKTLENAIPVGIHEPDWADYYAENTLRERCIRRNRRSIIRAGRVGKDILFVAERLPNRDTVMASEGAYIRCFLCSDLLPMVSARRLGCTCGQLCVGSIPSGAEVQLPQNAGVVRVFAKAQPFRWWQVWRRWKWWPRLWP